MLRPDDDLPVDAAYRRVAMTVLLTAAFMGVLDTTIVNVALPQIGSALHATQGVEWVVTAYLLAVGIGVPVTGWLADRFGRKPVFEASLALFTAGSLLAALSPTLGVLVACRVIQGLGGGALVPVGMAMVYELYPSHQRGKAMGIWGVAAMGGQAFGPPLGGLLVTALDWHWLFGLNVPVGIATLVAARRSLRQTGFRERRPFDLVGLALVSCGLVVWLYAFSQAGVWGWTSTGVISLLTIGGVLLVAFVRWQLVIDHPLIDLSMFRVSIFSLSLVIGWAMIVMQFARLVFLPLEFENVRGMTALSVGLLFIPPAIAAGLMYLVAGRITDRIGPRFPVIGGAALVTLAGWVLGHLQPDTSLGLIVAAMTIQGFGAGLAMIPNIVTGLNALPARLLAQASAVRTLNQRVAASFGVAVLATLVAMRSPAAASGSISSAEIPHAQAAYNLVFLIGGACALVGALCGFFLPDRQRNLELHSERAAEEATTVAEVV